MVTTARATARRLLAEARRLHPSEPPRPGAEDKCPRCGRSGLVAPDRDQLLTLLEWSVEDLTAADEELSTSHSSPYACLAWCTECGRLVVVRAEEVGLEYPPRHERDRKLLRCLVPCPYWQWCMARKGTMCDHCSGRGILERDEPEEAEGPTPPALPPAPAPARPLPTGPRELPPVPDEPLGEDEEWVWVPDEEEDDGVGTTEEGQGGAG
jgi:hypothetical protein